VAVVHACEELGFEALSEAMVNVRDALSEALRRGLIGQVTCDTIAREMKRRNYPERTWLLAPNIAQQEHLPDAELDALMSFVRTERPNRKRLDAIELLTELRRFVREGPSLFAPNFEFEATMFWNRLVADLRTPPRNAGITNQALRSSVRIVEDYAAAIFEGAW